MVRPAKAYLVFYNTVQLLGWSFTLWRVGETVYRNKYLGGVYAAASGPISECCMRSCYLVLTQLRNTARWQSRHDALSAYHGYTSVHKALQNVSPRQAFLYSRAHW